MKSLDIEWKMEGAAEDSQNLFPHKDARLKTPCDPSKTLGKLQKNGWVWPEFEDAQALHFIDTSEFFSYFHSRLPAGRMKSGNKKPLTFVHIG